MIRNELLKRTALRLAGAFTLLFAVTVVALVLSVNAVGDGLRDALDPGSAAGGLAR